MSNLIQSLRERFSPINPVSPGIYSYISPPDDPNNYRLFLRIDAGGEGILIINASTVLHLNQTASEHAFCFVRKMPVDQAVDHIVKLYQISRAQAKDDYQQFIQSVSRLIHTNDLDPVMYLGFNRQPAFTGNISAPYRLDCALTYRLPEDDAPQSAPLDRVKQELSSSQWKLILDKALSAGIPHIVFTGGEPTLRDDLVDLIAHVEKNGQVAGLISDGHRLVEANYLNTLLQTGLDHLTLICNGFQDQFWMALDLAMNADLSVAVHVTITEENQGQIPDVLARLADIRVKAISISAQSLALAAQVTTARNQIADLGVELIWNLPVPYSSLNPVALERMQAEFPEGAGRAWMYVEPDGDVLPTQGYNRNLGNLLSDSWEQVWKSHLRAPVR